MAECNHAVIQQKIYSKISKFQNECDILDKNVGLCRRIVSEILLIPRIKTTTNE